MSIAPRSYDIGADDPRGWMWLGLSIAALALLASGVGIHNGFAYDDRWIIVQNANAHSLNRPWELFGTTYWPTTRGASLYRPLTILLYAAQWVFGGGAPFLYHFVNISLYVVDAVLVLLLGLQCLPRSGAWVAAALFAVHPVHVEAVANVVGQAELWTGLVLLSAVLIYVRERQGGVTIPRRWSIAIVALYVAGMLIKENAIVLPALLVIAELFLVRDTRPWRERADELFTLLVWMTMFAVAFLWARTRVTGEIGAAEDRSADPLGQGHDDPLRTAHVGHAPDVLVLADVADQPVAVRRQLVDGRLEVVDLESNVAQPELVGHRGGRSGRMGGADETRELQPGTSVGQPKHDDLSAGAWDADDRVEEFALNEHSRALDLET